MKMTETRGWIWPKPTNVICLKLTENWQRRTFTLWTWPKTIEFDRKLKILLIMAQRRTFMVEYDRNQNFWSYSTGNVRRYGKFYWNFWSSSQSERLLLSFFGHIHSVKLTTLLVLCPTLFAGKKFFLQATSKKCFSQAKNVPYLL